MSNRSGAPVILIGSPGLNIAGDHPERRKHCRRPHLAAVRYLRAVRGRHVEIHIRVRIDEIDARDDPVPHHLALQVEVAEAVMRERRRGQQHAGGRHAEVPRIVMIAPPEHLDRGY